ncbi:MAG: DUF58 domain-containing protein [Gemmataceae bacterium]
MAKSPDDDPRRFLHPQTLAKITRLDLRAKQVVEGFISGMHKSPVFGHSVEFVQHREYTRGDDIRHLDWKVWSKTDRFYIKQFEAETNLRCNVVLDVSESMHYGRGPLNKYEYACTAAACLGYLLLRQQDACGLLTFDAAVRQIVPPRSQLTHVDALVSAMHTSKPREKTDILGILRRVTESIAGRGMVVVISDFLVDREPLIKGLEMLCQRKHDILVFHILDDDEMNFPFTGTTRFEGMEQLPNLLCDPRALRDGYLEALEEYLVEVRRGCTRLGIDYQLVRTGDYLDAVLSKFLHHRMDMTTRAARARNG